MKCSIIKQTLVLCILFSSAAVFGQVTYKNAAQESSATLEGQTISGYATDFSFPREEVRRGWWEYSRKFGNPINMKTFYKVKIPAERSDGNVDLMIYTQTEASEQSGVRFFIGVAEAAFRDQVMNLLVDFKRDFYIKDLNKRIEAKQKEASILSESYQSTMLADKRETVLEKLQELKVSISQLNEEIKEIIEN